MGNLVIPANIKKHHTLPLSTLLGSVPQTSDSDDDNYLKGYIVYERTLTLYWKPIYSPLMALPTYVGSGISVDKNIYQYGWTVVREVVVCAFDHLCLILFLWHCLSMQEGTCMFVCNLFNVFPFRLFLNPYYCGILFEQHMVLNRRRHNRKIYREFKEEKVFFRYVLWNNLPDKNKGQDYFDSACIWFAIGLCRRGMPCLKIVTANQLGIWIGSDLNRRRTPI